MHIIVAMIAKVYVTNLLVLLAVKTRVGSCHRYTDKPMRAVPL